MLYYIQAFVKALLKYNTQQKTGRTAHASGFLYPVISFSLFYAILIKLIMTNEGMKRKHGTEKRIALYNIRSAGSTGFGRL
jgi:hypothetical protein